MKKLLTILAVLCLVFSLAACSNGGGESENNGGGNDTQEEKPKIGVVVPDLNNAFCTAMDAGVTRAAKEKGYEVSVLIADFEHIHLAPVNLRYPECTYVQVPGYKKNISIGIF